MLVLPELTTSYYLRNMNNAIAGYHMLMILSQIDGNFTAREGQVIVQYMKQNFPLPVNFDREIEFLSTLPKQEYATHFSKAAMDFYRDSNEKEQNQFLEFAHRLVHADRNVSREENVYLDLLYKLWQPKTKPATP